MNAAQFLRHVIEAMPYALHTVLADDGIPFNNRHCDRTPSCTTSVGSARCMASDTVWPRPSTPGPIVSSGG